ncbi:MAG: hypothetical protein ACI351_06090 [Candidatus Avelusimicrobium sp.]|uniref:hypothetical protein n=1 Tax=Candidatus Avelusimicrobium sp. TaxID=3048833 RepID=UPI003F1064BC
MRELNSATVCLFINLLLLADKNGEINSTLRELQETLKIGSKNTILGGLKALEKVSAVSVVSKPNLTITVTNWNTYQAKNSGSKTEPSGSKSEPPAVQKMNQIGSKSEPQQIHKVPVPYLDFKNNKNIFYMKEKNILNFQDPQTDLEKLALYYLTGTNHPGLKKVNNNKILNAAIRMDIPHLETVLANCQDLEQAKKCVARYVRKAKGTYSLYYLACQINSIRQELESEEHRHG